MKKVKGKALSLVLSLALVISSFSAIPASAATKTIPGTLDDVEQDEFYLVNGGKDSGLVVSGFGDLVDGTPTMTTDRHKPVDDVKISAISRKSGDNLVKWYDASDNNDSIDSDTQGSDIALELRNSNVSGTEVLTLLYKGTYTDDNDNEYTVRAQKDVTIRVYDRGEVVLGEQSKDGGTGKGELDSDFAQKTVTHETQLDSEGKKSDNNTDSKDLVALKAVNNGTDPFVSWAALRTTADETELTNTASDYAYYLKNSSTSNIDLGATDTDDADATKAAGIETPALSLTGNTTNGITFGKVLSETNAPTKYFYTKSTNAPKLTDASAKTATPVGAEGTTEAASDKVTLTATDTTLTVVGYADLDTNTSDTVYNWQPVTKPLTVEYTTGVAGADTIKVKGSTDAGVNGSAVTADLAPKATLSATVVGEISFAAPATVKYYYQVNGQAPWTEVTTAIGAPAVTAGHSYTVKLVASTAADATKVADANILGTTTATFTKAIGTNDGYVTARVKDKASPASFTFTLEATKALKDAQAALGEDDTGYADAKISSLNDVKQKAKITKTIKVDDSSFTRIGKNKTTTYVYKGTLENDTPNTAKVNINGYEVKYDFAADVKVADKANVTKLSGKLTNVSIDEGSNVDEISTDDLTTVAVSDSKVDSISTKNAKVTVDSVKSDVGEIAKSQSVVINNGKVGNVTASDSVEVSPDDDESGVTVGDITSKEITIDSNESTGVKVGTIKVNDDDSVITVSGENDVTIGGIDFNYYGAELKLDGFKGSVPAPKNADVDVEGATISTQQADDKVEIKGDTDINSLSIADESTMSFDGKLNVGSIDGSGKLVVGLGELNVTSDASDVKLQISDAYKVGDVAYTSTHDTIDVDDMDNYGFTVTKSEGSSKDTFKVASTKFVGLSLGAASTEIADGYSQTFKATPYAPGTVIPEGYHVAYSFDGDDTVFSFTDNQDGTATIKTIKTDDSFASLNKGTLKAELVDTDGATTDDYDAAEVDVTAVKNPPVAYISDTSAKAMKIGDTYRFRITSVAGTQPTSFTVASGAAAVSYYGNSGKDYFYNVTAVKEGSYGVYVGSERVAILTITNAYTIDTKTVTKSAGQTYQFKVTGPSQPKFQVAGIGDIKLASKAGNDYFFKVTVPTGLAKGGHGVYVNGASMAVLTVA